MLHRLQYPKGLAKDLAELRRQIAEGTTEAICLAYSQSRKSAYDGPLDTS